MPLEKNILIVDDSYAMRTLLAELLTDRGFSVLQADSADAALHLASSFTLSAFLLDFHMPGMNGIELCRAIRARHEYRMTPIIMLTGSDEPDTLTEAFAAGCNDFVTKPVDRIVLLARLESHLQRMEYLEELERTRRMLTRYLSTRTREVAEHSTRTGILPAPEQRELAILFTDIRGFTALAEQMAPDDLFRQLSAQLADQVNLVYEYGGYIDKFGGDGVMAIFDRPGKARQACLCARRMIEKAKEGIATHDARMRYLGIGIHMGQAMIGNIGSVDHMDYSAIGTAVNLAARLCGQAEQMSIVVSDAVRKAVIDDPDLIFDRQRQVALRGLKDPVTVYQLL